MDGEKKPTPSDEPFVYTLAMQVVCQATFEMCVSWGSFSFKPISIFYPASIIRPSLLTKANVLCLFT